MNFGRAAAGQHYFVGFISLLSPQARGTSVKSWLFQSGRKGIFDESMVNWGPSLRSLPAIFTGQGHIYIVILISECVCKEWLGPASRWQHYNCQYLIFVLFYDWLLKICWFPIQVGQVSQSVKYGVCLAPVIEATNFVASMTGERQGWGQQLWFFCSSGQN